MKPKDPEFVCDRCGKVMYCPSELGYLGPKDRADLSRSPFQAFQTLCRECVDEELKQQEKEREG